MEMATNDGKRHVRVNTLKQRKINPQKISLRILDLKKKGIFGSLIQKTSLKDLSIW
jgi:hypothetical protein